MKFFRLISINIILLILVILSVNFICFCINLHSYKAEVIPSLVKNRAFNILKITSFTDEGYDSLYRKPTVIKTSKKSPIVIFGCSFVAGDKLNDNQTISAKLAKLTQRTVYNRGDIGNGSSMMLYSLQTGRIKELAKDCDTFIYVFIGDHLQRNLSYRNWPFLYKTNVRYELDKDNNLKLFIPNKSFLSSGFIINSSIYRLFEDNYSKNPKNEEKAKTLTYNILKETNSEIQKQFPNSEFIILDYSENQLPEREKLEKLGIKIVSLNDMFSDYEKFFTEEYQITKDNSHPNEKVWNEILPKLIAFTNIK